ncbi:Glyceraldehyde 3-phosphate dehydrogenase [Hirschfeldia incana]|nr:Glyceraldehyde 3-phosphate dehydrogenase [Hirschfeldia incana]
MASSTFSVPKPSLQGFTEFSGLRSSSASLPFVKKLSSAVTSQTSAMGNTGGYTKGVTEAKLKALHHLIYDSTLGIFDADVKPSGDASLSVDDGKIIKFVSNRNTSLLPWKELGIDIVIEGTGVFVDREVIDLVVQVTKKTFAEEVNAAFRDSAERELKGILEVCDEPLVSVDFRCSDVSSTIDSSLTMVMGDDMVKVIAWYDNEWGYSQRVVDLADIVANNWK